jgi:hypothetical protein
LLSRSRGATIGATKEEALIGWIVCGVAYVGCILFVRWLGGIGAAEDALRSWGEASSRRRRRVSSSSSS